MTMAPLIIRGMWGLGDNIYQRPFIRAVAAEREVYLDTPWPELYADLDIKFVRGERALRTQMRNVRLQPRSTWSTPPDGAPAILVSYGHQQLAMASILAGMERKFRRFGLPVPAQLQLDLPDMGKPAMRPRKPIAFVRPVTVRREWRNEARNPLAADVARIAAALMDTHHVVAVADLKAGEEWLDGEMPPCHQDLTRGQLGVRELLALIKASDVVVGGVGFIVPAALALRVRAFVLLGGHGGHNAPAKITDPRLDLTRIGFAMPDRFCLCVNMMHKCDKRNSQLPSQWQRFCESTGLACATSLPAAA